MIEIFIFIFSSYGLTWILMYGSILNRIRPKWELFKCSACTGFWSGFLLCLFSPFISLFTFGFSLGNAFVLACLSSGTSYILDKVFGDDGVNVKWIGKE